MRLSKFKTDTFAGINNREVNFAQGLNVILGPNEAGKSTMIEAIFATIFKNAKLKMNRGEDKDFHSRFMPFSGGDFINGILEFEVEGQKYCLKKEWGADPAVILELPDGQVIKSSPKIKEFLTDLFTYGEGTYGHVVFARQHDVKKAIENIIENKKITDTVSSFLRKAVMELDGISVEKLKSRIDSELDDLLKRWDYDNQRPENPNKDINNPYKTGLGRIIAAYYAKEQTKLEMSKARRIEDNYEQISRELKELREKRETIKSEIEEYARLEDDIFKRGTIEPEIKRLEEKSALLKEINQRWPVLKDNLKQKKEELAAVDRKIAELKEEKEATLMVEERDELVKLLNRVDSFKVELERQLEEKSKIIEVTVADIQKLEKLSRTIMQARASMEAATLVGKINHISEHKILITRGVGEKEEITSTEKFEASGYLRIELEDGLDLEIQSGEIDFVQLKEDYTDSRQAYRELLMKLEVKNLEQARFNLERLNRLNQQIELLQKQIRDALEGRDYEELKARAGELEETSSGRRREVVEEELEEVNKGRTELVADIRSLESTILDWQDKYEEPDRLLDELIEIRAAIKENNDKIAELAPLPEEFKSAEEFKYHLTFLRSQLEVANQEYSIKREELYEIRNELPEISYEELQPLHKNQERIYEKYLSRAGSLLKIKEVFERKLNEMDSNSFRPLVESFSKYLSRITAGNYQAGLIDDEFKIEISGSNNRKMPADINLLSFGTYDGVALALRFALLEQLFQNQEGFIILDDCLVNLDPERKKEAIELINLFAKENQVIFTTCDPTTAETLGGNIIELKRG